MPRSESLRKKNKPHFFENELDPEDTIVYKQWIHSGQAKLLSMTTSMEEFSKAADNATTHHYTAKAQSAYLRNLKETIQPQTHAIVLLDFAENYSFVCQDAIQGFHWDTS